MTTLLKVEGLTVELSGARILHDQMLDVPDAGIVGIVGESGSGKTMLLRALLDLLPEGGTRTWTRFELDGVELERGARLPASMVFQDPMTSFNPLVRIGRHLTEVARRWQGVSAREARVLAREALADVRIPDPDRVLGRYPHELSGGLRQRAMIAMALLANPRLLLADEPTTALDATVQAEILALLARLRETRGLSIVLVTHDLGVVAALCDSVAVMKDGVIVERGPVDDVFHAPRHPYTRTLLAAAPTEVRDDGTV